MSRNTDEFDLIDEADLLCYFRIYERHKLRGRSDKTVANYLIQLEHLARYTAYRFHRRPALADLHDDTIADALYWLRETRGWTNYTANKFRGCIVPFWEFLARKRIVEQFPSVERLKQPRRIPAAWTREQLARLFAACSAQEGMLGEIPARHWWHGFHATLWDSGGRPGEVRRLLWSNVDPETRFAIFRAETRKGQTADIARKLHPHTLEALLGMRTSDPHVFPWPYCENYLWPLYRRLLERAELPHIPRKKFKLMRSSSASWFEVAGGNASEHLDHSDPTLYRRHYRCPWIVAEKEIHAADVLFRPEEG